MQNDQTLKRVLITGGAGYVGSLLTPKLLDAGYDVVVFDIQYFGDDKLPLSNPRLTSIKGDLRDTAAFAEAVAPMLEAAGRPMPAVTYSQAQRWGSAMPSSPSWEGTPVELMGVTYQSAIPPLMRPRPPGDELDFISSDEQRLYYAGDYCSRRAPGFEAAALSAADAAAHIVSQLASD